MNCSFCGKEIEQGSKFCNGCGAPVPQEEIKTEVQYAVDAGNAGTDYQENAEMIKPIPNVNVPKPDGIGKSNASAIVLLILSIICCCVSGIFSMIIFIAAAILAIVSLVKSKNAENLWNSGSRDAAAAEIKVSKKLAMIGWILFGVSCLIQIIVTIVVLVSGEFGGFNNYFKEYFEEYYQDYIN